MSAVFQPFPMLPRRRAQVWRHQPSYRRPRHFHDEPELNVVVAGSGVLGVGDRVMDVSAGEMILFQPGQDHVLLESSAEFDLFVLAMTPELCERAVGLRSLASSRTVPLPAEELRERTSELVALADVSDRGVVETRLVEFFKQAVERAHGTHVLSRRALEFARMTPSLPSSVLARRLATAPSRVSQRFHADLGLTLVEYRARLKLMHFIELVDGGHPLNRAALEADFGSYAQCHRVFRRALGCSPRAYFKGERLRIDRATATE
jgi:AraC-like DNA-binding protein